MLLISISRRSKLVSIMVKVVVMVFLLEMLFSIVMW